tara:strand:+ start:6429 stop:7070 length:642 start_codon:yes stop_codon:yes gene_type:complete
MSNLSKRTLTSLPLFIILYLSIMHSYILSCTLFLTVFIAFYEFNNILLKIFKYNKLKHFILIFVILIYLIFFSLSIFFYLNLEIYNNKIIFIYLLSISISTDIGGYLFGKIFKGKKLTKISPNKTYSGMIGSLLLSVLISFIFFRDLNLPFNYLTITILLSIISQIGDLIISFLKRKAKIKDTGTFLPGHGGLLDRVDGILLTLPIGLIIVNI